MTTRNVSEKKLEGVRFGLELQTNPGSWRSTSSPSWLKGVGAAAALSALTKRSASERRRVEESITGDSRTEETENEENEEKAKRNERPAMEFTIHLMHP